MTVPVRLQLSRKRGFNLQKLSRETNGLPAVKVTRPGAFGNRFTLFRSNLKIDRAQWCVLDTMSGAYEWFETKDAAIEFAGFSYREWIKSSAAGAKKIRAQVIERLRGKNLACFCPAGAPYCHGLPLLEIANS